MRRSSLSCICAALVLLIAHAGADVERNGDEAFIGWKGETYRPEDAGGAPGSQDTKKWIETISWSPRAFVYHNFLSREEVDHIVAAVEKLVHRSQVIDTKTGKHTLDNIRTSYGAPLHRGQDPVIAAIEARIAEWTRLPADHGEPIQVLRYQNGQKYDAHWDWFDDPTHPADSGENRAATVLMYLGDVEEGGETTLPLGKFIDEGRQRLHSPSECATKGSGMAVLPRKGDALLFWDMHVDGTRVDRASLHSSCPTLKVRPVMTVRSSSSGSSSSSSSGTRVDRASLHASCPTLKVRHLMMVRSSSGSSSSGSSSSGSRVDRACLQASCPTLKGTKWTATKWIHNRPYGGSFDALQQAAGCEDEADDCEARVAAGKCDSEPTVMLGLKGVCRHSCKDCVKCEALDLICLRRNMRSLRQQLLQQEAQQQKQ
uniref:Fe2OG dioxygenase domain-containing protein n=1 Tax=Tetradesmus obliquus TaxID=3088 RepID=A0A383WBS8_TETOB|eukprot:jgi/Sobl393_1/6689/SZX74484.1